MSKNKAAAIWDYFEKSSECSSGVSKNVKVKCKFCTESVSYSKKATSNLVTHLQVWYHHYHRLA